MNRIEVSRFGRWILSASSCIVATCLQGQLVPTEVMYNHPDAEELEFIELENRGTELMDLTGAQFSDGIVFAFDAAEIAPGDSLIVAKDPFAFQNAYPDVANGSVFGGYEGQLSNKGERVVLLGANGMVLFEFEYSDGGNWPSRADGQGSSLELIPGATELSSSRSWQASARYGGAPGAIEGNPPAQIVVNEVLTHSDPPFQDAIELKNLGDGPVDLSGWLLSDTANQLERYVIPNGTQISPGGYRVFYEQELNFNNPDVPFSLSSAMGDRVLLTSTDFGGRPMFFIDDVSFGAAANGIPFGRSPDGVGPLVTLQSQTLGTAIQASDPPDRVAEFITGPGAPNAAPLVGPIVFSKIMYHPPIGKSEFLEFTNLTPFEVPLFDPLAPTNRWRLSGAVTFEFPPDTRIPPSGRVLVSNTSPELFAVQYPELGADQVFGPYEGSLNNAGERIRLIRPDFPLQAPDPDAGFVPYYLAEQVEYDDQSPWPEAVDGNGDYLVRRELDQFADRPENWTTSRDPGGNPTGDSDGDGIPDAWETEHGLDPSSAADAALDRDGDGFSNGEEYQAATDPNNLLDFLRISSIEVVPGGGRVALRFEVRDGIQYELETLTIPQSAGGGGEMVDSVTGAGPDREHTVELPVGPAQAQFFHLRVRRAP